MHLNDALCSQPDTPIDVHMHYAKAVIRAALWQPWKKKIPIFGISAMDGFKVLECGRLLRMVEDNVIGLDPTFGLVNPLVCQSSTIAPAIRNPSRLQCDLPHLTSTFFEPHVYAAKRDENHFTHSSAEFPLFPLF